MSEERKRHITTLDYVRGIVLPTAVVVCVLTIVNFVLTLLTFWEWKKPREVIHHYEERIVEGPAAVEIPPPKVSPARPKKQGSAIIDGRRVW